MKYVCRPMEEKDMPLVMEWRMQPDITRFMNTNPKLTLEGQMKWLEKIRNDDTGMQFMLEVDGQPVGTTSITEIDFVNSRCTRGVYIAVKEKRSMELMTSMYFSQFELIFGKLGLHKIEVEIFKDNASLVKLNKRIGFVQEGILRHHIKKDGIYYDVVRLGLLRDEWLAIKDSVSYVPMDIITDGYKVMDKINSSNCQGGF